MSTEHLLDIYTDYLISGQHQATATGLSLLLDGQVSHDKITRLLNDNQFGSRELWQYIKAEVRQHEQEKGGVLIIDDTIEEKPYTELSFALLVAERSSVYTSRLSVKRVFQNKIFIKKKRG